MKSVTTLTLAIFTLCAALLITCAKDTSTAQASLTWMAYVKAVRDGDTATPRSYYTAESQSYPNLSPLAREGYLQSKYTITGAEKHDNYIKLDILKEWNKRKQPFSIYAVSRDTTMRFQYPFLIFANNWPTRTSEHFILHRPSFDKPAPNDSTANNPTLDLDTLESFYARVNTLTGADYTGVIDYYACPDCETASQLGGMPKLCFISIGHAVISVNWPEYAEITKVMTARVKDKPIELIYYGLVAYAEMQRKSPKPGYELNGLETVAHHVDVMPETPLTALEEFDVLTVDPQKMHDVYFIGGALVDMLLTDRDDTTFRTLYQNSPTPDEFARQLDILYKTTPEALQARLVEKYELYF